MLACIRNGVVANVIIADGDFIKHIEKDFDAVVSAGNAGIGWTYDEVNGFQPPAEHDPDVIEVDEINPTPAITAPKKTTA
jgi:hypothetical protein